MADFTVHTIETAPDQSVALLQGAQKAFGYRSALGDGSRAFDQVFLL